MEDGEELVIRSPSGRSYALKNAGGVLSCSCPAWLHQSVPVERRTCKHLRAFRGEAAEEARVGSLPPRAVSTATAKPGAPQVLLAHSFDDRDPTGWWMSEKLDGVRAWWDGETFLSRQGNRYLAPDWFVAALPAHPLDGELFGGRGRFQETVGIARRADRSAHWRQLAFVVFDVPEHGGAFEDRLAHARSIELGEHARVLEHVRCDGEHHLKAELARVEAMGGEGVMLRAPGSRYVPGRSEVLLKVKSFYDAEATVVGHLPGTGKHTGRLGALQVELPDGTRFKVGTGFTDAEREDPPAVGTVVTFRYQELTRAGVPRFPSFLRVRSDV
ncbi:MAG: DNA ligase [Myxococcales bacterium]|nr:DNA ligase [Myxococcales bacterium]